MNEEASGASCARTVAIQAKFSDSIGSRAFCVEVPLMWDMLRHNTAALWLTTAVF